MTGSEAVAWWLVLGLGVLVLALAFAWWRATGRVGRENRRRMHVAQRGESRAEPLLRRNGYRITGRQETRRFRLEVDGDTEEATCRVDLLVAHDDGSTWVAEVKTGEAARVTRPQTRRQLLEYTLVFEVDGVLLVDMEAERIHVVRFPFLEGDG